MRASGAEFIDMLSLKADVALEPDYRQYALALRAIGQDLAPLAVEDLKIEITSAGFTVWGTGKKTSSPAKPATQKAWLKLVRRQEETAATDPFTFRRTYSHQEIRRLDELGRSTRAGRKANPDIYFLSERLRTVGEIVEARSGQLLSVVKDLNTVTIQYRDPHGEVQTEEHSTGALFRNQQAGHAKRGTGKPRDSWDGAVD